MFTEYQTTAALIRVLNAALSSLGVTGFRVMTRNPPNIVTDDQVVLLDRIGSRNIGFHGAEYLMPGTSKGENPGEVKVREEWLEEVTYQITALKKRKVSMGTVAGDTVSTFTQDDCISSMKAWLNSDIAATAMRNRTDVPMAPVYVSQKRTVQYQDENEVGQRSSQIDLRIQIVQHMDMTADAVVGFKTHTHPI